MSSNFAARAKHAARLWSAGREKMQRMVAMVSLAAFLSPVADTQTAPRAQRFEVASIKLNRSGDRASSMEFSRGGERFTAVNIPFGALVLTAYNITVRQLSGAPEFLSERYDVAAKAERPVKAEEMQRMLQMLLADRFSLVVRREIRDVPVYALTIAKAGAKLHPADVPADAIEAPRTPSLAMGFEPRSGHEIFRNESMPDFAWALSRMAGLDERVVVDNTALKGRYDFELAFQRERRPVSAVESGAPAFGDEPSIFFALQQQLGLKLESTKAPVEFLVIEHVETPTEN